MRLLAALLLGLVCLSPAEPGTRRGRGPGHVPGPCIDGHSHATIHASHSQAPPTAPQLGQPGETADNEEESDDSDSLASPPQFAIGLELAPAFVETVRARRTSAFAPLDRRPATLRC